VISGTDTVAIFRKAIVTYANPVSISENPASPNSFYLYQNSPNPFNPNTVISYQLPVTIKVLLKVYDILGKEIATLVNEQKTSGSYEVEFKADNLTSGTYFYKLQAGNFIETKKMILLR
jgi:hypothetical protein